MQKWRPPDPAFVRSILVILPTWVGDFVMATPLLRAVRGRFGQGRIHYLLEANLQPLAEGCPWVDEIIELPTKNQRSLRHRGFRTLIGTLRRKRFDLAVILPNSFRAAMTARLTGARRRIGYDRDGRGWLLTDRVPVRNGRGRGQTPPATRCLPQNPPQATESSGPNLPHWEPTSEALRIPPQLPGSPSKYIPMRLVDYYADLAQYLGCERPNDCFELFTTPACAKAVADRLAAPEGIGRGGLVLISPGAKFGASKCWMPERFAAVADRLIRQAGVRVFITCGPGEEPIAREIRERMQEPAVVADNPRFSLGELGCLIQKCDLLVCTDSGPRHIAKAFGRPVVTVFGPTHVEWTATQYPLERIVRTDVACGPCQQRVCPLSHLDCLTGVTVEAVGDACMALLEQPLKSWESCGAGGES